MAKILNFKEAMIAYKLLEVKNPPENLSHGDFLILQLGEIKDGNLDKLVSILECSDSPSLWENLSSAFYHNAIQDMVVVLTKFMEGKSNG